MPPVFGHEDPAHLSSLVADAGAGAGADGTTKHSHAARSEVVMAGEAFGWVILVIVVSGLAVGLCIWASIKKKQRSGGGA